MGDDFKVFYILGFPHATISGAVVLDSFQSNGSGQARLAEVKREHFGKFKDIYLLEAVA